MVADTGRRLAPANLLLFVRFVDRCAAIGVDQTATEVAARLLHFGLRRRNGRVGRFVAFVRHLASGGGLPGSAHVIVYGLNHVFRLHGQTRSSTVRVLYLFA